MIRRPTRPRAGSAALRRRLRLVVAGDVRPAIEDPGAALGDGAVKCDEFRVEAGLAPAPGGAQAAYPADRAGLAPQAMDPGAFREVLAARLPARKAPPAGLLRETATP